MTIRLLDPPLHEFLPEGDIEEIVGELSSDTGMSEDEIISTIEKLSEVNPMLGFRGCRCQYSLLGFGFDYEIISTACMRTTSNSLVLVGLAYHIRSSQQCKHELSSRLP